MQVGVTLSACADPASCSKKTVQFPFLFRDPNALWVKEVSPVSAYVDGRIPLSVQIENVPSGLVASDFVVIFKPNLFASIDSDQSNTISETELTEATNAYDFATLDSDSNKAISRSEWDAQMKATVVSVVYKPVLSNGLFELTLTVTVPASQETAVATPQVKIPKLNIDTTFPVALTYLAAPSPSFGTIVPAKAKTTFATPVKVTLRNFAGVTSKSDIEMQFRWSSGTIVPAAVTSFSALDSTKHAAAIQDYDVMIMSPVGTEIQEGSVQLISFHSQYRRRVAKMDRAFSFLDATSPEIVGISSPVGTGTDSVLVQMSKPTQVLPDLITCMFHSMAFFDISTCFH